MCIHFILLSPEILCIEVDAVKHKNGDNIKIKQVKSKHYSKRMLIGIQIFLFID